MEKIELYNPELQMYKWWSKVRWFMVLILFAIGILRISTIEQTYPIIIFIATFVGISILNVLFHLQIIKSNNLFASLQIILDILFSTLVVHLTGGLESSFVWIYLIAVITASLSIETAGGVIAAMIGSMCLLMLILMYNFGWLLPINQSTLNINISEQTIFLISYTGLFSGIAFISTFISDALKKVSISSVQSKEFMEQQDNIISEKQKQLLMNKNVIDNYQEVVRVASSISSIDHDINNPLTILSLSIRRIIKSAETHNDEKLAKSGNQMTEAINNINEILTKIQKLKKLKLIQEERKKNKDKS